MARANTEWAVLQAQAEVASEGEGDESRVACAADLLASSTLDRLRPYVVPAEYVDIPPLAGGEVALEAFLQDDARLVMNFFAESSIISGAGKAFWQAELYLRSMQETPGEASVEEAAREAGKAVEAEASDVRQALRGSLLLARQNFVSSARFGYFLRRGKQRWALEKGLAGLEPEPAEELDDWLTALRKKTKEVSGAGQWKKPKPANLEQYLDGLPAEQCVELVRVATREANMAIQLRATALFGSEQDLMEPFDLSDPGSVEQCRLSAEGRRRLHIEAAAFGAALFEAEEAAARIYGLSYTAYGSREERE